MTHSKSSIEVSATTELGLKSTMDAHYLYLSFDSRCLVRGSMSGVRRECGWFVAAVDLNQE